MGRDDTQKSLTIWATNLRRVETLALDGILETIKLHQDVDPTVACLACYIRAGSAGGQDPSHFLFEFIGSERLPSVEFSQFRVKLTPCCSLFCVTLPPSIRQFLTISS